MIKQLGIILIVLVIRVFYACICKVNIFLKLDLFSNQLNDKKAIESSETLIIQDKSNSTMSTDLSTDQTNCFINPNNNNFLETLKDLTSFKNEAFSVSSDSDYIDSSRSNSIDSEKSTEKKTQKSQELCLPLAINSDSKLTNSKTDKSVTDSGISSPTSNFTDYLNTGKKEKCVSSKDRFPEKDHYESALLDSAASKLQNSKFPLRLPKTHVTCQNNNSSNIGNIVTRIRSLSISYAYNSSSRRPSGDRLSLSSDPTTQSPKFFDVETNPSKIPKEYQNSSINFTSKNLRTSAKWLRMSHSLSCDAESYNFQEFSAKKTKRKFKLSNETVFVPNYFPVPNRLEKFLSGHIDASTPSGALLKVINEGLKKVSESDRYLLFSKSPIRSPIDFLESGIEHLGDTEMLITVLHHSTCYDLMPESGKLVVFDSEIPIDKAFTALNGNYVDSAPIWNGANNSYCGMFTKEDQIHCLSLAYELYQDSTDFENDILSLFQQKISVCIERDPGKYELQIVYPENTIATAISQLEQSAHDKVLVVDEKRSGNGLFILDHGYILSFLLNASKVGLPLPSVLKTSVGVTELMMPRTFLNKYHVFMDSDMPTLLRVMSDNPHHCAVVCAKKIANLCSCKYDCLSVITVDHISNLLSSKITDPTYTVRSLLSGVAEINLKIIRCTERDSVIDIIKLMNKEKASIVLINPDRSKKCVHSIMSAKELLNYIMKHDRNRSPSKESLFSVDKRRCCRTISYCEDSQRVADKNLSEVSLDEKDEDVFNMEMT